MNTYLYTPLRQEEKKTLRNAEEDFKKSIKLRNKLTSEDYRLCAIRGRAKLALDRVDSAKQDLEKTLKLYR